MAVTEPGVNWSQKTEDVAPSSTTTVVTRINLGRRITPRAIFAHVPDEISRRSMSPLMPTGCTPRRPSSDSSAGCSVRAEASEKIGTTSPAAPSERTKGTGTMKRVVRPIATAKPESTTVRPALNMVLTMASSTLTPPLLISARKRWTISSE